MSITKIPTCTSENRFGPLMWNSGYPVSTSLQMHSCMGNEYRTLTGSFDAGAQPHGTQISATTSDDDPDIHVSWKDAEGRIVTRKRSKNVGFGASVQTHRVEQLDGRDWGGDGSSRYLTSIFFLYPRS